MKSKNGTTPSLIKKEKIATIRLRRPDVANRLQDEDLILLNDYLQDCQSDPHLRVLVICADGKYFSAGYNIGAISEMKNRKTDEKKRIPFEVFADSLENIPLITVAAIQGPVFGGSTDIALACDFRIGTPAVSVTMPAVQLGVHLYPGALKRYVTRLGLNHAKRMILTAERILSSDLLAMGFLNEMVPEERLNERTRELCERISCLAPISLRGMKEAMNAIACGRMDEDAIRKYMAVATASADLQEGTAAWLEKRLPIFSNA
jgi:enoyl-CoA hydratase/carnithine racemase